MGGFFWEDFLGGFFWKDFWGEGFGEEFFVFIGIDLFFKILIFVKICLNGGGQEFRSLEVQEASSSHLKSNKMTKNYQKLKI